MAGGRGQGGGAARGTTTSRAKVAARRGSLAGAAAPPAVAATRGAKAGAAPARAPPAAAPALLLAGVHGLQAAMAKAGGGVAPPVVVEDGEGQGAPSPAPSPPVYSTATQVGRIAPRSTVAALVHSPGGLGSSGGPRLPVPSADRVQWGRAQRELASAAVHLNIAIGMKNMASLAAQAEAADAAEAAEAAEAVRHPGVTPESSSSTGESSLGRATSLSTTPTKVPTPVKKRAASPGFTAPEAVDLDAARGTGFVQSREDHDESRASRASQTDETEPSAREAELLVRTTRARQIEEKKAGLVKALGKSVFEALETSLEEARLQGEDAVEALLMRVAKEHGMVAVSKLMALAQDAKDLGEIDERLREAGYA